MERSISSMSPCPTEAGESRMNFAEYSVIMAAEMTDGRCVKRLGERRLSSLTRRSSKRWRSTTAGR